MSSLPAGVDARWLYNAAITVALAAIHVYVGLAGVGLLAVTFVGHGIPHILGMLLGALAGGALFRWLLWDQVRPRRHR